MDRIEALLARSVASDDPRLSEVATHLINAGGKRIRPTLAMASAIAGGCELNESILLAGVAVELVHLASLYHDDVMDEATTRRNVTSVNAKWGNLIAIVAGDFLLARAAGIAARLSQSIAELLADTLARLCEGQILEVNSAFETNRTQQEYFSAISGKTASLMATSCKIGALAAGLEDDVAKKLDRVGYLFGMVYQIRDDVLDIIGSDDQLGKAPGQDLLEGIYTLPTIIALENAGESSKLRRLLDSNRQGAFGLGELSLARREILISGALEQSVEIARTYCDEAAEIGLSLNNPVSRYLGDLSPNLLDGIDALISAKLTAELAS
ncbi:MULTISPECIES: polyprenyl synthetase family protein [Acidithrix]|uniref:Heptaprenyl diphosphate synthase component 2 n=1 Tax=Acidithrix ferrooxidans TaxID=1280514 RepID=A0A0D8HJU3_9ACTN|nr:MULTISPECIES: polyprenyl synthetase family protein [Acidithrix]KJF18007.1 heptaprenyl diphosphate synthase component 2 [Acidithrix ferrooxidans]CAG4918278.1 unnamed protein product [Acidithrix sp. C25]